MSAVYTVYYILCVYIISRGNNNGERRRAARDAKHSTAKGKQNNNKGASLVCGVPGAQHPAHATRTGAAHSIAVESNSSSGGGQQV